MEKSRKDIIPTGGKSIVANIRQTFVSLFALPLWYIQHFQKRDKNLWTFGAWSGEQYSDNSRALYEYVLTNHPEIRCVWITRSNKIYNQLKADGKPVALCTSIEGKQIQRKAGYFFMTSNHLDADIRQMNGIRFVNLWHGMPLKKIGEDAMEHVREKGLWKRIKTKIRKMIMPWEFISGPTVCGSPFFIPFLQSAFQLRKDEIYTISEPRLSRLNINKREQLIEEIDAQFNHPLKVLYMPTFRDSQVGSFNPFSETIGFNDKRLESLLVQQNIVFLYKGHFVDNVKAIVKNGGRLRTISDDDYDDLYWLLNDIDVLITDYSSVYFDFLCLRRPMILFPFDYEDYVARSREFYFDYELMEAIKVFTWQELEACLSNKTYHIPSDNEMKRFRPSPIGDCREKLVKLLCKNT